MLCLRRVHVPFPPFLKADFPGFVLDEADGVAAVVGGFMQGGGLLCRLVCEFVPGYTSVAFDPGKIDITGG